MDVLVKDAKGILWQCRGCGYEISEQYDDPDKIEWHNKKAWEK